MGGQYVSTLSPCTLIFAYTSQEPVEGEENDSVALSTWKNLNSFNSLLVSRGPKREIHLPIWEIRSALEEPATRGPLTDCRVWVAAEWILNCSDALEREIKSPNGELTGDEAGARGTGELCDDSITPRGLQRWEFWKKRLAEILNEADTNGLEEETKKHGEEALKVLESWS
jgi:hypothetical protein